MLKFGLLIHEYDICLCGNNRNITVTWHFQTKIKGKRIDQLVCSGEILTLPHSMRGGTTSLVYVPTSFQWTVLPGKVHFHRQNIILYLRFKIFFDTENDDLKAD